MRRIVFVFVMACRSQSAETQAPQILPQTQATAAVSVAPSAPARVCEPTVSCGAWSPCKWLVFDHADAGYDVFRAEGVDAGRYGSHYWRMHQCWPVDAGPKSCALYCDAAGACVDAFTGDSVCTVTHAPQPSPFVCEIHGADCVTAAAPNDH